MGESWFRQEYCCSFESVEGLVYPDFACCVVDAAPVGLGGRRVGGIDFGFRNPFAAVWGTLDGDDVLWLTGEHYSRGRPLSHHALHLPREVMWYADPAGANERCELLHAGFRVHKGTNALGPGIAAVSARIESGTLRVEEIGCPNLLREAQLYRYDDSGGAGGESPLSEHNHALDALRYLIFGLDARRLARRGRPAGESISPRPAPAPRPYLDVWSDLDHPIWTRIF